MKHRRGAGGDAWNNDDGASAGKALRQALGRRQHGAFALPATRQDPVAILEAQARTRLPELVPIRYARMLTSPFAFLRGAAAVMAHDLATTATTGLTVQACGDMHVANFGVFRSLRFRRTLPRIRHQRL